MSAKKFFLHLRNSAILLGLAVFMTWPLALHLNTHIPGDGGDGYIFLWDLWWVKHALLTLRQNPFHCQLLYAPQGVSLTFHTLLLFTSLVSLPLQFIFSLPLTFNLLYLAGFVASGLGMLFFLKELGIREPARWIGTLLFIFSSYVMARSMGHFNLAAVWPLPWTVAYFWRVRQKKRKQDAFVFGLLWGLSLLNEYHYAFFLGIFIALVLARDLSRWLAREKNKTANSVKEMRQRNTPTLVWDLKTGFVAAVGFFLVSWPIVISVTRRLLAGASMQARIFELREFSLDVFAFFLPDISHPLWGKSVARVSAGLNALGVEHRGYLGLVTIILCTTGVWLYGRKKVRMPFLLWLGLGGVFAIFSLGPFLKFGGQDTWIVFNQNISIPLPWFVLRKVPFWGSVRTPDRFVIMAIFAFAIAAAFAFDALTEHFKLRGKSVHVFTIASCAFILFDLLSIPLPLSDARIPNFYKQVKSSSNVHTILDIPLGWRSGQLAVGNMQAVVQYYQVVHEKKIVSGYISRVPDEMLYYYPYRAGMAGFMDPWKHNPGEQQKLDYTPAQAKQTLDSLEVDAIIVHKDMMADSTVEDTSRYLKQMGLQKNFEQDDKILFTLAPKP